MINNYSLLYFFVCTVNLTTVDFNKLFEKFQFESHITTMCDEGKDRFGGGGCAEIFFSRKGEAGHICLGKHCCTIDFSINRLCTENRLI